MQYAPGMDHSSTRVRGMIFHLIGTAAWPSTLPSERGLTKQKGSEMEAGTLDLFHSSAENELLETQKLSDKLLLENLVEN